MLLLVLKTKTEFVEEQGHSEKFELPFSHRFGLNHADGLLTTDALSLRPIAVAHARVVTTAANDAALIRNLAVSCASCIRVTERYHFEEILSIIFLRASRTDCTDFSINIFNGLGQSKAGQERA